MASDGRQLTRDHACIATHEHFSTTDIWNSEQSEYAQDDNSFNGHLFIFR